MNNNLWLAHGLRRDSATKPSTRLTNINKNDVADEIYNGVMCIEINDNGDDPGNPYIQVHAIDEDTAVRVWENVRSFLTDCEWSQVYE